MDIVESNRYNREVAVVEEEREQKDVKAYNLY